MQNNQIPIERVVKNLKAILKRDYSSEIYADLITKGTVAWNTKNRTAKEIIDMIYPVMQPVVGQFKVFMFEDKAEIPFNEITVGAGCKLQDSEHLSEIPATVSFYLDEMLYCFMLSLVF